MLQIDTWKRVLIWLVCVAGLLAALPNAFYTRVEQSNDAWAQIEVEGETLERLTVAEQWPEWMPSGLVNLGLDLRGGAHLLAEVQVSDVYTARMDALWPEVRNVLRDERGTIGTFRRIPEAPADQIRLRLSDAAGMSRALELVRGLANPVTSLTGAGATDIEVSADGDILVVQLASATMEQHKDDVLAALIQVIKPSGILLKNDSAARDAEGLNRYVETAFGLVPEWVALEENGVKFEAPVMEGQKTGWFYDHRMNRARLAPYVKGKRVLDLFSYIGGWGVQAGAFGASEVFCVDASGFALDGVERNAGLNGFAEKVTCIEGDVFEALKELKNAEERFDVIVADPPAFIKRKKDLKNGEGAYRRLNEQAMRLLSKDGILVSASCSMHLPEDDLQNILLTSARHLDRNIQLLERGGQGPDHPVHPAIAETRYIKSITCRLLPNS